jgi:hypothetical protein
VQDRATAVVHGRYALAIVESDDPSDDPDDQEHAMYGPGTALPPQPNRAVVIGLRVLFTVLPIVTLGVAAWGSVLRLALMRRRRLDWALLPVVAVLGIGGFILIGASDEDSTRSNVGAAGIFACMLAVPVYFLVADILWSSSGADRAARAAYGQPMPPHPYTTGTLHGAARGPIPGPPATPPAMTGMTGTPGQPQYGYGPHVPQPPQPPATPAPQTPPARINQVRAELDELSDYLRKEEGR